MSEQKYKSLVQVLEDVVLALEDQGQTDVDIHSMVNMILKGWIRNGQVTEEYVDLARLAKQQATQRTVDAPPGIIIAKR